jgi:hypothetical protein
MIMVRGLRMHTLYARLLLPLSSASWRGRPWRAVKRTCGFIATCLACCRQGYAAAAHYDELARLSNTELDRRGMTRGDIYRHIRDELDKDPFKNKSS